MKNGLERPTICRSQVAISADRCFASIVTRLSFDVTATAKCSRSHDAVLTSAPV